MKQIDVKYTFSDLKNLLFRKRKILASVFVCGFISLFFCLIAKSPVYKSKTLFYDKSEERELISALKKILGKKSSTRENQTQLLLQSRIILVPVIEKLGLQVTISEKNIWQQLLENIKINLFHCPEKKKTFVFQDVKFHEGEKLNVFLKKISDDQFEILDDSKNLLEIAALNQPCHVGTASFVLKSFSKDLEVGRESLISFIPLNIAFETLSTSIRAQREEEGNSFLEICCSHEDRQTCLKINNEVVSFFAKYLQDEKGQETKKKISYLKSKQKKLSSEIAHFIDERSQLQNKQIASNFSFFKQRIDSNTIESLKDLKQFHCSGKNEEQVPHLDHRVLDKKWDLKIKTTLGLLDSVERDLEKEILALRLQSRMSRVVEKADLLFIQKNSSYFFLAFVGALFLSFLSYLYFYFRSCFKGFRLSKDLLEVNGLSFLGFCSNEKDRFFETANFISDNFKNSKLVSLIQGKIDFSKDLAEVLFQRGFNVLIIDSIFDQDVGWFDHYEKKIEKGTVFDTLILGKKEPGYLNKISSLAFYGLLNTLKKEYAVILFASGAYPCSMEAKALFGFSDQIIVAIEEETLQDIEFFFQKKKEQIGFLLDRNGCMK